MMLYFPMKLYVMIGIPLLLLGMMIGCGVGEEDHSGSLSSYATDAGQTFHVLSTFRISLGEFVTQVIIEGHQYVIYDGYQAGGVVHSASCPHASHPGMGEIY